MSNQIDGLIRGLRSDRNFWRKTALIMYVIAGCLFAIGFGIGAALC
ncbi:MAG: hypothetical protein P1U50_00935 [Parvibaculaceae bacterium]|nr:hypothetical protein [Parvibaculaceae bacterium]